MVVRAMLISEVIDGQKRYTVALRFPNATAPIPTRCARSCCALPAANRSRWDRWRASRCTEGPELINREQGQRRIVVMSNVRSRDLGSFVAEVRSKIEHDVALPPGYFIEYGGQFENQQRATRRLMLIVPIVIALIFVLLYLTFSSAKLALLVVGNVPFALVGGVAALWIRGMNLNLSASIGFIALFGIAMLNGVVLVSSINQLTKPGPLEPEAVLAGVAATAAAGSDDRLRGELRVSADGAGDVHGGRGAAPVWRVSSSEGCSASTLLTLFLVPLFLRLDLRGSLGRHTR